MTGTLLWAEDDPNDILLVGRAMKKVQLDSPQLVRDGEEVLAYLSGRGRFADRDRHPYPSLVLLDLKLPKVSGFEVLQWVRAQPGLRRIPLLVFTSSKESDDIDRAYELGANAYLVKPVDMESLLGILRQIRVFWMATNRLPSLPAFEGPRRGAAGG